MTDVQQRKLKQGLENSPNKPIEDAIEEAKTGAMVTQINVTIGPELLARLQRFADDEGASQDDAAVSLIDEGLEKKGYID
jgi:hypothetical protein